MDISYFGHSCFRIRGRDTTVVTDPFSPKYGFPMGKPQAGIVTISTKDSPDSAYHTFVDGVGGEPYLIEGPGEYEVANVLIYGVRTHSRLGSDGGSTGYRLNTAYVIDMDDIRVCHLGELMDVLTAEQVEAIGSVNVLIIPVGGGGTLGGKRAVEVASQLEPNIVIPMHYRIEGTRSESLEPVDRFINEMGAKSITPVPKLSVGAKSSMPIDLQVSVLESKRG
jgi:L-ascorbate metabolism protein UlaG (beta-lactamase superfamily)